MDLAAIVFDFDGLILETEEPQLIAWQEVYARLGQSLTLGEWSACIGRAGGGFDPLDELAARLGEAFDPQALRASVDGRARELITLRETLPGVLSYLTSARQLGLRTAIASSSTRAWVEDHLGRLDLLGAFDQVVCFGDVAASKPAPDVYVTALERMGARPGRSLALEDSPPGIAAAKAAGMWCVAVPTSMTRELDLSGADLVIESLEAVSLQELIQLLAEQVETG